MTVNKNFESIISHLIGTNGNSLVKINISSQFDPAEITEEAVLRNLNAAFLIALAGEAHPLHDEARQYMDIFKDREDFSEILCFFKLGLDLTGSEIKSLYASDGDFSGRLDQLYEFLDDVQESSRTEVIEQIRKVFFPEGYDICRNREGRITKLRENRKITVTKLNKNPITNPEREILFTSNILITTPPASKDISELPLSAPLRKRIEEVVKEEQRFWYDHPIQLGVETDENEAVYGLRGLDEAVRFEKGHGTVPDDAKIDCVLSVSTTHKGLQTVTKDYLEEELKKDKSIRNLNIYLFNESDTLRLIEEILMPAADHYLQSADSELLHEIIGVDGEYGRHYSFLKAVAALWNVMIDPAIRATFKIDLDQIFPQDELLEQTGESAFQHLKTPLWGAQGSDNTDNDVELGMIAGALVNERDICNSLFCADVCFPTEEITADNLIFYSSLPQALSTEAEMMARYTGTICNGTDYCIQRIHVTGGTCGILVDSLRKYRPFTPTFIGRAEDQAYLLSVLFSKTERNLRYVHKDGLIMRHDKEAFAQEAIKTAYLGKLVGDYARILWFSYYVRALPWPFTKTKELIDPFTGCFASHIPFTVTYLRLSLKVASLFGSQDETKKKQGAALLQMGANRLFKIVTELNTEPNPLVARYTREKKGWNLYYDILDHIEKGLKGNERFAAGLREKARELIKDFKVNC
jgi:hypothetical protein